jgi:hypothetical protein
MDLIVPVLVRRYQRLLKLKKNGGKHEEWDRSGKEDVALSTSKSDTT